LVANESVSNSSIFKVLAELINILSLLGMAESPRPLLRRSSATVDFK